ncbi:bifunctional 4-hydroxy-2-oxoglutarate aldolase/2-dehydro-3-deoxy-phosphogluconate aldolase [Hwanghaeella grinnelliae]|uniref:2-dehydro-3-deoxy-phosphogluconate aldolase n=1 Tax=Hwanghaeella grinnelliae TaxID=2500179 RepID=A0A437QJR0_9PROT|nr:bifunctional 4-hydroxy-2-oxoglutarate aldolase/2-dehydro-3-deoxy-phosphogluconate aldolase [Hwanghaeella grinnelliae]RVU34745.1 bifunctional 4-hydroxy-2-oxoglutarate aldolase/2-dehydro-3-deoxy-phosphogluconate aldolase [Hwanghaeella grinnelliae]
MLDKIDRVIAAAPVIPVVTVRGAEDAVPLARALAAGGLPAVEVTLRTPGALAALEAIAKNVPEAIAGAGTVLSTGQAKAAADAGAAFLVSPGATDDLIAGIRAVDIPWLPGAATASEVMRLREAGFFRQKFFPAEQAGGAAMLKGWGAPLPDIVFCPTGGITAANAQDYLSLPNVGCVGGSWVAPAKLIAEKDWAAIEKLAKAAAALRR